MPALHLASLDVDRSQLADFPRRSIDCVITMVKEMVKKDVWSFLYKQCTSSLPLFQRNTNKQTHEDDRMLKQFRATVPFFSQMVRTSCVCLLVLRWKRGGSLCIVCTKNSRHVYQPPVGPQNLGKKRVKKNLNILKSVKLVKTLSMAH